MKRPKSITENLTALVEHANHADILRVFKASKPDDAATYAYQLEAVAQGIEKEFRTRCGKGHTDWLEMILAERLRLYYSARETNPRLASELLTEIEAQILDTPAPPDLGRIRAAAEASDLIEAAVRVLKPRDKRLFNALPNHFRRVEVEAVAARIDYSTHTAYRRAVPRFVKLGLLERTDDGYCKAVASLPT